MAKHLGKKRDREEEEVPAKKKHVTLMEYARELQVSTARDIQTRLMGLVPKALAVKKAILEDEEESRWLQNTVASDVLDRTLARPSQNVTVKGAIVTASYTDEELKEIVLERMMLALETKNGA